MRKSQGKGETSTEIVKVTESGILWHQDILIPGFHTEMLPTLQNSSQIQSPFENFHDSSKIYDYRFTNSKERSVMCP